MSTDNECSECGFSDYKYSCKTCKEYQICEKCAVSSGHNESHEFVKRRSVKGSFISPNRMNVIDMTDPVYNEIMMKHMISLHSQESRHNLHFSAPKIKN